MLLQFLPSQEEEHVWNVIRDGEATGDIVFQRHDAPGRYFLVLNSASLNVMGTQMSYPNLDEITKQLRFYYANM